MNDNPRQNRRLRSVAGFSLIETMVAVLLISTVGVIVAQLLQKNAVNLLWNQQTRKATALADMVLEKYDYLASVNFSILETFNQTKTPVSAFFVTGVDEQGYDGMYVTTVTDPPSADGSRKLTMAITWGAGGPKQTYQLVKYLAPGTGEIGGAPVHVYVLGTNGLGMAGFEIRALHHFNPAYLNAFGTNEVIGYTNADGYALLNNVSVNPALQPMLISARRPGSNATVKKSDPLYSQGYYAGTGNTWNNKTLTVTQTTSNLIRYDLRNNDFRPLAGVSGLVTNTSGASEDLKITMSAARATSAATQLVSTGTWSILTSTGGAYEFNNIGPGAITLSIQGVAGSTPTIAPGPGFAQGYVGFGGNGASPWIYQTTMFDPATDILYYNAQVRPLGSLLLTATNGVGLPLAGANIRFIWPEIGFGNRGQLWNGVSAGDGTITLYNMFAGNSQPVTFNGYVIPAGCPNNGSYKHNYVVNCSADQVNPVTMQFNDGATLSGIIAGPSGVPLDAMQVSVLGLSGTAVNATTAGDGSFTLCGISPDTGIHPSWPTVSFSMVDVSNRRVAGTFQGSVVDNEYPSLGLSGLRVLPTGSGSYLHNVGCAFDPLPNNTATDIITSDPSGLYGPMCAYLRFSGSQSKAVTGGPSTYSAGTITVSTASMPGNLTTQAHTYYKPRTATINPVVNGSTYDPFLIRPSLVQYAVSGILTDSTSGIPLQGITFNTCSTCPSGFTTSCPVTTAADGSYGPIPVCVRGRTTTVVGTVVLTVPSGLVATNTGFTYAGGSQVLTVPTPAIPATPLTVNLTLNRSGGGI